MTDFVKLLEFDSDSEELVRGVEIGRIWERLKFVDEEVCVVVHTANAEMMLRIAEATGRSVQSDEHDGRWMTVIFAAKET